MISAKWDILISLIGYIDIKEPVMRYTLRQLEVFLATARTENITRAAESLAMLGFVMVNDSHLLLPYRQALLWDAQAGRLLSLSGLASVEHDAPFVHWISQQCRQWQTRCAGPALTVLHADSVAPEDQAQWADYLPPHLVWLPLVARNGQLLGALLLAREQPLGPAETALLPLLLMANKTSPFLPTAST